MLQGEEPDGILETLYRRRGRGGTGRTISWRGQTDHFKILIPHRRQSSLSFGSCSSVGKRVKGEWESVGGRQGFQGGGERILRHEKRISLKVRYSTLSLEGEPNCSGWETTEVARRSVVIKSPSVAFSAKGEVGCRSRL